MAALTVNVDVIRRQLEDNLSQFGFEIYPLKVGWYNSVLPPTMHLAHPDDTLALVVLSTPAMFEQTFLPFMEDSGCCQKLSDPIDQCVKHRVSSAVSECFPGQEVDVSYDYEMLPSRKPKFLAQTAAHVSGASFYYQQTNVSDQPWAEKKMFGVCVHPKFGGWFAIRALLVFGGVTVGSELEQPLPPDCVPSREGRIKLLEEFNYRWQDWKYRDIVPPVDTYSQKQRDYFSARPAERFALLKMWGFTLKENDPPNESSDTQSQVQGHG